MYSKKLWGLILAALLSVLHKSLKICIFLTVSILFQKMWTYCLKPREFKPISNVRDDLKSRYKLILKKKGLCFFIVIFSIKDRIVVQSKYEERLPWYKPAYCYKLTVRCKEDDNFYEYHYAYWIPINSTLRGLHRLRHFWCNYSYDASSRIELLVKCQF